MSLEENKALVRAQFERVINLGELNVADATIAPEYIDHAASPGRERGPESMREFARRQRAQYPDAHVTIEDILAESDRGAVRIVMRGTPANGAARVAIRGTVWWRIAEGKIVERWGGTFVREEVP